MSDHMTAAEWRGYCAYQNDVPRDKNPYVIGPEAAEWDDGWLEARLEDNRVAGVRAAMEDAEAIETAV